MAAIDKVYVNGKNQCQKFLLWCFENNQKCYEETHEYLLPSFGAVWNTESLVLRFSDSVEWFIYTNCPLEQVKENMKWKGQLKNKNIEILKIIVNLVGYAEAIKLLANLPYELKYGDSNYISDFIEFLEYLRNPSAYRVISSYNFYNSSLCYNFYWKRKANNQFSFYTYRGRYKKQLDNGLTRFMQFILQNNLIWLLEEIRFLWLNLADLEYLLTSKKEYFNNEFRLKS